MARTYLMALSGQLSQELLLLYLLYLKCSCFTCFTGTALVLLALLPDGAHRAAQSGAALALLVLLVLTCFACFPGTKVQILTLTTPCRATNSMRVAVVPLAVLALLDLLVQKYKYLR
jgi:hypothetical protein